MRSCLRFALVAVIAASFLPGPPAEAAGTLRFSWSQCAGDALVSDRQFSCDVDTGQDDLVASAVFDAGTSLTGVSGFMAEVDINVAASPLPPWWQVQTGQCRANAVTASIALSSPGVSCDSWYASSGLPEPLWVASVSQHNEASLIVRLSLIAWVPPGYEVTLPAGREIVFFRIRVGHAKTTGTGACAGCTAPACIGFGYLALEYRESGTRDEFVGTPASVATWQGAGVLGFAPVPGHSEGPAYVTYKGNLQCSATPVPVHGRTWGMIKSLYR